MRRGGLAVRNVVLLSPPYLALLPATAADVASAPLGAIELQLPSPEADLLALVAASPLAAWVPLVVMRDGGSHPVGGPMVRVAQRWVTLLHWPAHRPRDPAACVAHVRACAAPSAEDVVDDVWQPTGSAVLATVLRELAATPRSDPAATASRSRRLRRLGGTLGASDWRRVLRLACLPRDDTDRLADQALRLGIDERTLRRWITELLGAPPAAFGALAGWQWIVEAALRHARSHGITRALRACCPPPSRPSRPARRLRRHPRGPSAMDRPLRPFVRVAHLLLRPHPGRVMHPARHAALCGALLLLPACADSRADAGAAADTTAAADSGAAPARAVAIPVAGRAVRVGDLVLTITTTGQVRAEAQAELRSEAAGTVIEVRARPGDRVRRGDVLVALDPRPFDLAVQEAEAAVRQAEIAYRDNIVPDSVVTGRAPTEERRQAALARSGLESARVRLERARLERERAAITAPFDGVVDRVDVAAGARVNAGQAVALLVDLQHLRVEAQVLEHDLPLVHVGGEAVVSTPARPDRPLAGRVAALLPLVDSATRAGRAVIRLAGDGTLRPGMSADVQLEAARLPRRTLVPAAAVIERDGRPLVFVVREGRAQWVYIVPGRSNGRDTEVLPDSSTGLLPVAAGDTVLIDGHLTLTHDAPVRLVADDR